MKNNIAPHGPAWRKRRDRQHSNQQWLDRWLEIWEAEVEEKCRQFDPEGRNDYRPSESH